MPALRFFHAPLFALITVSAIIQLAIAASVVSHWNTFGYPSKTLEDRSRLSLASGIICAVLGLYFTFGVFFAANSPAFGILVHLVSLGFTFILLLASAASMTEVLNNVDCGQVTWSRCYVSTGIEVMDWITTILVFIALIFVLFIGIKARSGAGIRRGTLSDA